MDTASASSSSYMLPARKRPRRTYSASSHMDTVVSQSAAHYLQYEMPDEVIINSGVLEKGFKKQLTEYDKMYLFQDHCNFSDIYLNLIFIELCDVDRYCDLFCSFSFLV